MTPLIIVQTLLPALVAGIFTMLGKTERWDKLPEWLHQLICGVAFGLVAIIATETGTKIGEGAIINVRDAAPVVAGLAFGGPAGIIAGVIGAVERWFSVLWGAGEVTRLACCLSTLFAGVLSALLSRFVFKGRSPSMGYAAIVALIVSVMDMLLILLTNLDKITYAFQYVDACSTPMILLNSLAAGLALMGRGYIRHDSFVARPPFLINDLGIRLFVIVFGAFLTVTVFMMGIAIELSASQASAILMTNLDEISVDVEYWGWSDLMGSNPIWRIQETGQAIVFETKTGTIVSGQAQGKNIRDDDLIPSLPEGVEELKDAPYTLEIMTALGQECYAAIQVGDDYSVVVVLPCEEGDSFTLILMHIIVYAEILVHSALFLAMFQLVRKRVVENLSYVGEGLDAIADGNLDTVIDVRSHQEFSTLSDDVNSMVSALKGYISEAEHRRDAELEFARQIQHAALPSVFPPFPERHDFDVFASMDAAREVGGDFYDFFLLDNHTLVFLVADVSGKGIPAALFMMNSKTEIHALMETGMDVEEALTRANRSLSESNETDMFVTAWLGKLDLSTGELTYANAGHNPPLVCRADGAYEYLRTERPNLFLAGMETTRYRRHSLWILPGDKIFLYTDGVTEACDPDEAMFGERRLQEVLDTTRLQNDPRKTCETVRAAVSDFANGAEQSDDVTMLCVDVRALRGRDQIITRADTASIELVRSFFEERLPRIGVSPRIVGRVLVVVDEAYSNICNYGNATKVVVSVVRKGADILVEFTDDGVEFDPTAKAAPDTTLSASERAIGGLGIHMMRKMSKSMAYQRVSDTNILSLVFDLE